MCDSPRRGSVGVRYEVTPVPKRIKFRKTTDQLFDHRNCIPLALTSAMTGKKWPCDLSSVVPILRVVGTKEEARLFLVAVHCFGGVH